MFRIDEGETIPPYVYIPGDGRKGVMKKITCGTDMTASDLLVILN